MKIGVIDRTELLFGSATGEDSGVTEEWQLNPFQNFRRSMWCPKQDLHGYFSFVMTKLWLSLYTHTLITIYEGCW